MKDKLFVGIPAYGTVPADIIQPLMQFVFGFGGMQLSLHLEMKDSLVARARNSIAAKFLASDCTHLLQLDSDLVVDPAALGELVMRDEAIVGGLYPKKKVGPCDWVINKDADMETRGDLAEVSYIGTGLLRIKRDVFETMVLKELVDPFDADPGEDGPKHRHDFFPTGVVGNRYLSEDYYFCHLAKAAGYQIWADTNCRALHLGQVAYPTQHG